MLKQAQALYENMTRNAKALRVRLGFAAHGKEILFGYLLAKRENPSQGGGVTLGILGV